MKRAIATLSLGLFAGALACAAQAADIKIGVIYDYTGAFAGGGSKAAAHRQQDRHRHDQRARRRRGPQDRRASTPTRSRRPTSPSTRPSGCSTSRRSTCSWACISSAHCVPMAAKVDAAKKFMWANVCVASAVFKDKNLQLRVPAAGAFRPVRRSLVHVPRRERQGEARQGGQGPQGRDHPRGRPLRRRRRAWATRPSARSSACRSCTRKAMRRPRPISPRW